MGNVILPPKNIETDKPIIFLAGPISNAPRWQREAASYLLRKDPSLVIASPCNDHYEDVDDTGLTSVGLFDRQRAWERHYLDKASQRGAILFWLPKQAHSTRKNYPYGGMTRLELGQWMTEKKYNPSVRLVIGTDGGFDLWDTIAYDLQETIPCVTIHRRLEDTCDEALQLVSLR